MNITTLASNASLATDFTHTSAGNIFSPALIPPAPFITRSYTRYLIPSVFCLDDCGIDLHAFQTRTLPSFTSLEWDYYELRGRQLNKIKVFHNNLGLNEHNTEINSFLEGTHALENLSWFRALNTPQKFKVLNLQPRRKRAVGSFMLTINEATALWDIARFPTQSFVQNNSNYYPSCRHFTEMDTAITDDGAFQKILHHIPELLAHKGLSPKQLKITCHQVSLIATQATPGHGSPEGIHQDGADYIITALVIHRENISGAQSRAYIKTEEGNFNPLHEYTLMPGEGLFQADQNTPLWHDVTPIVPFHPEQTGYRNSFGFDITIVDSF